LDFFLSFGEVFFSGFFFFWAVFAGAGLGYSAYGFAGV
jgi:hypothetical protein